MINTGFTGVGTLVTLKTMSCIEISILTLTILGNLSTRVLTLEAAIWSIHTGFTVIITCKFYIKIIIKLIKSNFFCIKLLHVPFVFM